MKLNRLKTVQVTFLGCVVKIRGHSLFGICGICVVSFALDVAVCVCACVCCV